ncbi:PA2169 family four-helix-bundle protein [Achromobacter aloeverae]|uniref:Aldehyde dehydrogenase n=1 Tax=Achromobacter aloeverae TaxID=1750518 RepID=A0A4Q1HRP9_9BURK|nr:PA2169 family four-helix-bundle protein [Achromobacter aloeverae]RXN93233.1 aldehyde dehydrogenase [Achromobacter aloeverae]
MADRIVKLLNDLVETAKDGEKGFLAAAEDTRDQNLRGLFQDRATDCGQSAQELQTLVTRLGGTPETGGHMAAAVHRGWVHLKAAVAARSDADILRECERGEDIAKRHYADALREPLPEDIRDLVERQYTGLMRHHDQIRDLHDRYRERA